MRNLFCCLRRLVILLLVSPAAAAYDFVPTDSEWMAWPDFCKARYVTVPPGDASQFKSLVPPEMIQTWSNNLGTCWGGVHHYCAGLAQSRRAATAKEKDFKLVVALDEHSYVHRNCPIQNPFWSNNETHLAMVLAAQGKYKDAYASFDAAIKMHPTYDGSYLGKAIVLKRQGKLAESRQVLLVGDKATNGESAEIQNALGLSYFDSKDYETARGYAEKAYKLGFPLPGLRNKLQKAGYPVR